MASVLGAGPRGLLLPGHVSNTPPSLFAAPSNLVAYYGFDPDCLDFANSKALDLSGNGKTASFTASPTLDAGPVGTALAFNGTTQAISTPLTDLSYAAGTIVWWMKPTQAFNSGATRPMWGQLTSGTSSPEFSAQVFGDNNFYVGWNTSADRRVTVAASATNYPQGVWSFYTFVWATSGSLLYQNGSVLGTNATGPVVTNIADAFNIARLGSAHSAFWGGSMDDFRIYSRALQPWEIIQFYRSGLQGRRDAGSLIPLAFDLPAFVVAWPPVGATGTPVSVKSTLRF